MDAEVNLAVFGQQQRGPKKAKIGGFPDTFPNNNLHICTIPYNTMIMITITSILPIPVFPHNCHLPKNEHNSYNS